MPFFSWLGYGIVCAACIAACYRIPGVSAQGTLRITITPPLFQLSIKPGDIWSSSIRVVNTNDGDLTIYATVADFVAEGEGGHGKFIPLTDAAGSALPHALAGWLEVPKEPFVIPKEKSAEIPFTVRVPAGAEPGGHYAAILIGTKPMGSVEGSHISVASYVTSLLFLRVAGNVSEEGSIREFITERSFYQTPDVEFSLRFENAGNVHLLPQGDISITNMWGKERGSIPINQNSLFGSVLPSSIRKYVFEWQGEENIFDFGKYKAVATLAYGSSARQNLSATAYFWIVPLKPVAGMLGGIIALIACVAFAIKAYVRKVLHLEAQQSLAYASEKEKSGPWDLARAVRSHKNLSDAYGMKGGTSLHVWAAPLREGIADLKRIGTSAKELPDAPLPPSGMPRRLAPAEFFWKYRLFFVLMTLATAASFVFAAYLSASLVPSRNFDIIVHEEPFKNVRIELPVAIPGE